MIYFYILHHMISGRHKSTSSHDSVLYRRTIKDMNLQRLTVFLLVCEILSQTPLPHRPSGKGLYQFY